MTSAPSLVTRWLLRWWSWHAGLHHYDYLQRITFRASGGGEMIWGDGQAVRWKGGFRYSFDGAEQIEFHFPDLAESHRVGFELLLGPHVVQLGCMGGSLRERRLYLLRFDADPFPPRCGPPKLFLDYYSG